MYILDLKITHLEVVTVKDSAVGSRLLGEASKPQGISLIYRAAIRHLLDVRQ